MPYEFRNGSHDLEQNGQKEAGVQTIETHPLNKKEEMFQVEEIPGEEKGSVPVTTTGRN